MSPLNLSPDQLTALRQLADLYGVATHFWDYKGRYVEVQPETIIAVLRSLGADVDETPSSEQLKRARQLADESEWRNVLPPCTVIRQGHESRLPVNVPHGSRVWVHLDLEDGSRWELSQQDLYIEPHEIDGQLTGRATFSLPSNLPLGYHTVISDHEDGSWHKAHLIVVPNQIKPAALADGKKWGVAAQLYSVFSDWGWGLGDAADLSDLATVCAQKGADFVLINPLHATEPTSPISDSPYLPVTRNYVSPQYIRPEWITEVASLTPKQVKELRKLSRHARKTLEGDEPLLGRDAVWKCKQQALEMIFGAPRSISRQAEFARFRQAGGQALEDFGLWCAIFEDAELEFTDELTAGSKLAAKLRVELANRIEFHIWLQWIVDEQLRTAQDNSRDSGMSIGVVHDLAVGIHPSGVDVWSNPDYFAPSMQVGAPPDFYNQQGQNWSQPPWSPTMLEVTGYRPLRNMLSAVLAHAGGVRIDHILGLFRLWWIPFGAQPSQGTYVKYDHEAMVGVLLLEALRAGVVVIGEDLGTVEPWVRDYLAGRGVLGTSVFWFERESDGSFKYPDEYRREALATVNTHDLPPSLGYLRGVHTDLREELGLLSEDITSVREADAAEVGLARERLHSVGLLDQGNISEDGTIAAMHRFISRTPAVLTALSLVDAVGEVRPQNQPGTFREYPNWRIPLSDSEGKLVKLSALQRNERFNWLAAQMNR